MWLDKVSSQFKRAVNTTTRYRTIVRVANPASDWVELAADELKVESGSITGDLSRQVCWSGGMNIFRYNKDGVDLAPMLDPRRGHSLYIATRVLYPDGSYEDCMYPYMMVVDMDVQHTSISLNLASWEHYLTTDSRYVTSGQPSVWWGTLRKVDVLYGLFTFPMADPPDGHGRTAWWQTSLQGSELLGVSKINPEHKLDLVAEIVDSMPDTRLEITRATDLYLRTIPTPGVTAPVWSFLANGPSANMITYTRTYTRGANYNQIVVFNPESPTIYAEYDEFTGSTDPEMELRGPISYTHSSNLITDNTRAQAVADSLSRVLCYPATENTFTTYPMPAVDPGDVVLIEYPTDIAGEVEKTTEVVLTVTHSLSGEPMQISTSSRAWSVD